LNIGSLNRVHQNQRISLFLNKNINEKEASVEIFLRALSRFISFYCYFIWLWETIAAIGENDRKRRRLSRLFINNEIYW